MKGLLYFLYGCIATFTCFSRQGSPDPSLILVVKFIISDTMNNRSTLFGFIIGVTILSVWNDCTYLSVYQVSYDIELIFNVH